MQEHNQLPATAAQKLMATLPFGFGGLLIGLGAYLNYAKIGVSHDALSLTMLNTTHQLSCVFKSTNPCSNSGVGGCNLPSAFDNIENKTRIEAACQMAQILCQSFFNNKTVALNVTLNGQALNGHCDSANNVALAMVIFGAVILLTGAFSVLMICPSNCSWFQKRQTVSDNAGLEEGLANAGYVAAV